MSITNWKTIVRSFVMIAVAMTNLVALTPNPNAAVAAETVRHAEELDSAHQQLDRDYDHYYRTARKHGQDPAKLQAAAAAISATEERIQGILKKNRDEFFEELSKLEFQPDGSVKELPAAELAVIRESTQKKEPLRLQDFLAASGESDSSEPEPSPSPSVLSPRVPGPQPTLSGAEAESPSLEDHEGPRQFQFKGKAKSR